MGFLFISISVNAATHLLLAANSNHLLGKHFYFSAAFVWPFANILHNLGQDGNAGGGQPLIIFGSQLLGPWMPAAGDFFNAFRRSLLFLPVGQLAHNVPGPQAKVSWNRPSAARLKNHRN